MDWRHGDHITRPESPIRCYAHLCACALRSRSAMAACIRPRCCMTGTWYSWQADRAANPETTLEKSDVDSQHSRTIPVGHAIALRHGGRFRGRIRDLCGVHAQLLEYRSLRYAVLAGGDNQHVVWRSGTGDFVGCAVRTLLRRPAVFGRPD